MRISLLCSDPRHPVIAYLKRWVARKNSIHKIELCQKKSELNGGDILFLVSCAEIISPEERARYRSSLVLHASDLPRGRGWSPHIWEILRGAEVITLSLIEAEDNIDSGRIWAKSQIRVPRNALWDEINHLLFAAEIDLIDYAVEKFDQIKPQHQDPEITPTFYSRRNPQDSQIDVSKSIAEQFDLIRVCDPVRYPAYFEYLGHRYILRLEKSDEH